MIESSFIQQSYFSNKIDGNDLADILRSQKPSGEMLLDVAQMNQTHSNKIEYIETEGIFSSDGLVTSTKNISLVVKTADCMPVLIKTESSIAALHVGWKGLQNDIFKYSSNFMRLWNEGATIILFAVVFLIIVKDAFNWIYGVIGIFLFSIIIMLGFKFYKRLREKNKS